MADDHVVVRSGLRLLLEKEPGFEVVGEVGDIDSARRSVRGHKPDVLVLDLHMPGGSSLESIATMRKESPGTEIVILTMDEAPGFARQALSAGAVGYVLKGGAHSELVEAVRRAAGHLTYLNPALGAQIALEPVRTVADLSEREHDVLRLVALGFTNVEVAARLFLSVRTVETHRAHIQSKLNVSSRAELVEYALSKSLIGNP